MSGPWEEFQPSREQKNVLLRSKIREPGITPQEIEEYARQLGLEIRPEDARAGAQVGDADVFTNDPAPQDAPWMDFAGEPEEEADWMDSLPNVPIFGPGVQLPLQDFARFGVGAAQGAAGVLDNAANLMEEGYNQTLGRVFGESSSADNPAFSNLAAGLGRGSDWGKTAGEIGAATYLTRRLPGPVTQGMGAGALLSEAETPLGFARDVAIGGVGGKAGDLAIRGTSRIIAPVVERSARTLNSAGVRLTPGQAIPALREVEDKAMSWPFVGSQIARDRRRSFEDLNRAPLEEALQAATGQGLPAKVKTGNEAVRYAGDRLSTEYNNLIPKLSLQADQQLIADVQTIGQRLSGSEFTPSTRRRFESMVRDGVMSRFTGATATGAQYHAADKFLTAQIARFGKSTEPDNQAIAEGLRDLQGALSGALVRSNPAQAAKLEALNRGWAMLVPVEDAASRAPGGIFSPGQYRQAIRSADKRVRKRGMARGEARGQELADAASEVLPSQYPNPSGTAGHEAYSMGNMRFWQGLAARPLYNALAGPVTRVAMAPRPAFAEPIADSLKMLPAPTLGGISALNAFTPIFSE